MANPNPICFQTSTYGGMGGTAADLQNTLAYAVALGARCVELPVGYTALTASQLNAYNSGLAGNDVSRTISIGPPPPPPPTTLFTGILGTKRSELSRLILGSFPTKSIWQTATSETIAPTFDAISTSGRYKRTVAEGVPPATDSVGRLPFAANLLTANQSSLETDATGWDAVTNCTIAASPAQALDGLQSLAITSIAAGDMVVETHPSSGGLFAIPISGQVTIVAWFLAATTPRTCYVVAHWYDSTGTSLGTTTGAPIVDTTMDWMRAFVTGGPTGLAYAMIELHVVGTAGAAEVHYADQISLSPYPANANLLDLGTADLSGGVANWDNTDNSFLAIGALVDTDTTNFYTAPASLKVTTDGVSAHEGTSTVGNGEVGIPVAPSTMYTATVRVKGPVGASLQFAIQTLTATPASDAIGTTSFTADGTWQVVTASVTGTAAARTINIAVRNANSTAITFNVDSAAINLGSNTAWTSGYPPWQLGTGLPFVTPVHYVRSVNESVPPTLDNITSTSPATYSTFLAVTPLPMFGEILDASLNFVTNIPFLLTRPVIKASINGGFTPVTLDLPASNISLQNGYIVRLYESGGDGSVVLQGVIENLPDTYDVTAVHQVTVSPMVIFLGTTSYSANWAQTDIAVIVRDIVSQCPYLTFTPQSIQNVAGTGNLLSAENASFEGGTTGGWLVGTTAGLLGTTFAQPGLMQLGVLTDGNVTIANATATAPVTTGLLGAPGSILATFQMGALSNTLTNAAGGDGRSALQITFTSSNALTNVNASLHLGSTPASPGGKYTFLASMRAAASARTWTPEIVWLDVNGIPISTSTGAAGSDGTGYISLFVTDIAPANTATATVYIVFTGAAQGEIHYLDMVSFAANASQVWTPGTPPGAVGTATLSFDHVSALQALTTCVQSAGPYYYFFVDEIGVVWFSRMDPSVSPTYILTQGASPAAGALTSSGFSKRDFSAPIDTLCNFVEIIGGNQTFVLTTTLSTAIPATSDVSTTANSVFNVALWNYPPGQFVIVIDGEQMLVRAYGDLEIVGGGDMSVKIYQRGYAGTTPAAHAAGAVINTVGLTSATVPITAFYDGTNGAPKRAMIPPAVYSNCYDYATLQHIANTLGQWLNRQVIATELTLPVLGKKIRLNAQLAPTVSYWEPSINPLVESYAGSGMPSPNLMITDVEIDGGVQKIMLSDLPFTSEDLQYFTDNMIANSAVVAAGALQASAQIDASQLGSSGNAPAGVPL